MRARQRRRQRGSIDPKRNRRTISAPLGGVALAMVLLFAIPMVASAAGRAIAWTRQFGTSGEDSGAAIVVDGARNIYVAGCTSGTLPNGTSKGGEDAYLRKIRPGGRTAWTRQFGTSGIDCVTAIAIDGRGWVVVVGRTTGAFSGQTSKGGTDAFLRVFRRDGRTVRTRQFGTSGTDVAHALAIDSNDRVLVVGRTTGAFASQTTKGGNDAFLRTYRPDGSTLRTRQFGTSGTDAAIAVAVDSRDRVIVAGRTGGVFSGQTSEGNDDAFVRMFRSDGRTIRTRQFGTTEDDRANAVAVDSRDRTIIAGWTTGAFSGRISKGGRDGFVRTFGSDGRTIRTRQFGTSANDNAHAIAVDSRDRILVAGWTSGGFSGQTNKGNDDAFLRMLRPDGRTILTRQFGTSEDEIAHMIAVDSRGRILVAGWTEGTLPGQTSKGGTDAFVRAYRH